MRRKKKDKIEIIYESINEMVKVHGTERPERFGGGRWNFNEEIKIWKRQIKDAEKEGRAKPLSELKWIIIDNYISIKRDEILRRK